MGLQVKRANDKPTIKAIAHRVADIPGGVGVATADLGGSALLEGTPVTAIQEDGLAHVVKTAKVMTRFSSGGTKIEVAKGHQFKAGQYIGDGTKAQKITDIDRSKEDKDVITVGAALNQTFEAGSVLEECTGADAAVKYKDVAGVIGTSKNIEPGSNHGEDVWVMAVVWEKNAPVSKRIKDALKGVLYI